MVWQLRSLQRSRETHGPCECERRAVLLFGRREVALVLREGRVAARLGERVVRKRRVLQGRVAIDRCVCAVVLRLEAEIGGHVRNGAEVARPAAAAPAVAAAALDAVVPGCAAAIRRATRRARHGECASARRGRQGEEGRRAGGGRLPDSQPPGGGQTAAEAGRCPSATLVQEGWAGCTQAHTEQHTQSVAASSQSLDESTHAAKVKVEGQSEATDTPQSNEQPSAELPKDAQSRKQHPRRKQQPGREAGTIDVAMLHAQKRKQTRSMATHIRIPKQRNNAKKTETKKGKKVINTASSCQAHGLSSCKPRVPDGANWFREASEAGFTLFLFWARRFAIAKSVLCGAQGSRPWGIELPSART